MADFFALTDDQLRDAGTAAPRRATSVVYITPSGIPSCSRCQSWERLNAVIGRCGSRASGFAGMLASYAGHCPAFIPLAPEGS